MQRYRREIGPAPAPKRGRLQKRAVELSPCLCEECRAISPIRQALWEAKERAQAAREGVTDGGV